MTVWLNSMFMTVVVRNSLILFLIRGIARMSCTRGRFVESVLSS